MDSEDSSGDDVFECGRCKERFFDYSLFKTHKKNRVCKSSDRDISCKSARSLDGKDVPTEILNNEAKSNIVDLATELTFLSDISNASRKSASQLIDHDYMFIQTQVPEDDRETEQQQSRSKDTCMLCPANTHNLHDHLEKEHMIEKEKVLEFVSHYSKESSLKKLVKKGKPTVYKCTECKTVFKTLVNLEKHVCQKAVCAKCTTVFKSATLLKNHTCSTNKTCEDCDCSFTNFVLFMKHVCSKSEVAFCNQCKVQFLNRAHMQRHNCSSNPLAGDARKFAPRTRRCSLCQFSSIHSSELLSHFREQHMGDIYFDEENNSKSSSDTEEPKNQSSTEKVKCRRCKRTVLLNHLEKHILKCQDGKGKMCILCNHYSRDTHDYAIHVDTHKVWFDLDAINKSKEKERLNVMSEDQAFDLGDTNDNKRQTYMDCSTLSLDDIDKNVKIINKEQLLISQPTEEIQTETNLEDKNVTGQEDNMNKDFLQVSRRNINCRKCKCCGRFIVYDVLPHHMLTIHNKIKLFRCFLETCLQVFSKLDRFDEHVKSHPENKDMLWCGCKTCVQVEPSGIAKRKELRKEKMRQYYHNMMYKCETCWSKFPTEAGLKKHKSNDSHNYPCHICGKIQVSVRQLKTHILTHDTARHHLCDICGLGYKTSRDLKKHRLNHTDARPYICDSCGKAFPTKFKLNRHNLCVHNPVKAFACTHEGCERKFSRKDKLKDHQNTHLAVEPFKCPYCSKGFYRSDNLRDHEVLHTRDYRFKCNICNKGYMRPKLLEVHKQREHGDQQVDKQDKQDVNAFPLYTLYTQQPIQILPDAIQALTAQTVQQIQQVVNEQQQQAVIEAQYHQTLVNTGVPRMTMFDSMILQADFG